MPKNDIYSTVTLSKRNSCVMFKCIYMYHLFVMETNKNAYNQLPLYLFLQLKELLKFLDS